MMGDRQRPVVKSRWSNRWERSGYTISDIRYRISPSRSHPFSLSSFLPLLLSLLFSGCGISLFSSSEASITAHAVFLTQEGCSTFVTQMLREGLSLIETEDASYTPTTGDVFEGPGRVGPSVFRLFDGEEVQLRDGGRNVSLTILARNLEPEEARRSLNAACL